MAATLAAIVVETTVVTRRCNADIVAFDDLFNLLNLSGRIVNRLRDTQTPFLTLVAKTLRYYLTAYIYEEVLNTFLLEQTGNDIATVAFRDSACIHLNTGIHLQDMMRLFV